MESGNDNKILDGVSRVFKAIKENGRTMTIHNLDVFIPERYC